MSKDNDRILKRKDKTERLPRNYLHSTIDSKVKRQSVTVGTSRKANEQKLILISPISKIKRHLIDHINFQELQNAMYHKSNKITLYEHFCNSLKQRKSAEMTTRSQSKKRKVVRVQEGIEDIEN